MIFISNRILSREWPLTVSNEYDAVMGRLKNLSFRELFRNCPSRLLNSVPHSRNHLFVDLHINHLVMQEHHIKVGFVCMESECT